MWGQVFNLPPAFQPAFFGGRETPGIRWNAWRQDRRRYRRILIR
jgi:hypothetical protein